MDFRIPELFLHLGQEGIQLLDTPTQTGLGARKDGKTQCRQDRKRILPRPRPWSSR